jgi:hypothetical protein
MKKDGGFSANSKERDGNIDPCTRKILSILIKILWDIGHTNLISKMMTNIF